MTVETHESNHTGHLQHPQAILQIEVDKNVAREQHQVQFFAPIFPSANTSIHGQETTYPSLFQLPCDLFLVTGTYVGCVPVRFQMGYRFRV